MFGIPIHLFFQYSNEFSTDFHSETFFFTDYLKQMLHTFIIGFKIARSKQRAMWRIF